MSIPASTSAPHPGESIRDDSSLDLTGVVVNANQIWVFGSQAGRPAILFRRRPGIWTLIDIAPFSGAVLGAYTVSPGSTVFLVNDRFSDKVTLLDVHDGVVSGRGVVELGDVAGVSAIGNGRAVIAGTRNGRTAVMIVDRRLQAQNVVLAPEAGERASAVCALSDGYGIAASTASGKGLFLHATSMGKSVVALASPPTGCFEHDGSTYVITQPPGPEGGTALFDVRAGPLGAQAVTLPSALQQLASVRFATTQGTVFFTGPNTGGGDDYGIFSSMDLARWKKLAGPSVQGHSAGVTALSPRDDSILALAVYAGAWSLISLGH